MVIKAITGKAIRERKEKLRQHNDTVFIEIIKNELGVLAIGLASMVETKDFEDFEAANRVIAGTCSLAAFDSQYSYAYMCGGDHINIIRTVTYGQSNSLGLSGTYHLDNIGLLLRRDSARQYRLALIRDLDYQVYQNLAFSNFYQRLACDHQSEVSGVDVLNLLQF